MKNLFGCLGALLIFPLILVAAILFHGWYLQVIYNIGLVPIGSQFGLFLPQLGYWVFVLIHVVICSIKVYFKGSELNTKTEKSENTKQTTMKKDYLSNAVKNEYSCEDTEEVKSNNIEKITDALTKLFSQIFANILTKLYHMLFIYIAFTICF